ncbi:MAG: hypothetical protein JJ974_01080 [Phycisphaerales bacterium]|nr:hypothetical protein [Phycisphaerales bacterium]
MNLTTAAISALILTSGYATAGGFTVTNEDSFLSFGAEMPYGDGNMNTNFNIARYDDGSLHEIGLKAKERFIGDLTTDGNGRYFADAGSPGNDGLGTWNIDYAFALPQDALPTNYQLLLSVDFDSGFGSQSFVTLDITNALAANLITTPAGGDSQNLGFGFWGTSIPFIIDASGHIAFDPDALGEYDIELELRDATGNFLAKSAIVVEVIPAPGSAALLGLGALTAIRRRR